MLRQPTGTVHASAGRFVDPELGNLVHQVDWTLDRVKDLPPDHPIGELYDMQADPSERHNLWNERQDVVKRLTSLLEKYQHDGRSVPAE